MILITKSLDQKHEWPSTIATDAYHRPYTCLIFHHNNRETFRPGICLIFLYRNKFSLLDQEHVRYFAIATDIHLSTRDLPDLWLRQHCLSPDHWTRTISDLSLKQQIPITRPRPCLIFYCSNRSWRFVNHIPWFASKIHIQRAVAFIVIVYSTVVCYLKY